MHDNEPSLRHIHPFGIDFGWTPGLTRLAVRIIEDASLVDMVEDWSRVRSPSRARRRRKRGFRQNIVMRAAPKPDIYSIDGGRTIVMHPEVARVMKRRMTATADRLIQRALTTGVL